MKVSGRSLLGLVVLVLVVSAAHTWWMGSQHRALGREVASLASDAGIRMISSETCDVCMWARSWMTEHGVRFSECKIELDAQCRADYEALRSPGTPVMVVRGEPHVGFSPERLRETLKKRG